jgi:hypothetical protein
MPRNKIINDWSVKLFLRWQEVDFFHSLPRHVYNTVHRHVMQLEKEK